MLGLGLGLTSVAPLTGGGDAIGSFFADLALSERAWWSYDAAATRFQTTAGLLAPAATEPVGLWLDKSNLDGRGIVNRVAYSQRFDNAAWAKTNLTVSANAGTAPDGTTTADKLVSNAVVSSKFTQILATPSGSGVTHTFSLYAKPAGWSWVIIQLDGAWGSGFAYFDVTNGTIGTQTNLSGTSTITSVGDGWYRITISDLSTGTTAAGVNVFPTTANNVLTSTGDGTSGVLVWGAQVEVGSTASAYQENEATLGGPGNHVAQSVGNSRPTQQTTGVRGDGGDDSLLSAIVPGTVLTKLVKATFGATGSARTLIGGTVGTARCMLARDSAGLLSAGVGTDSIATIKGGSDLAGLTGTGALVYNGSTVSLYWRQVGGALQTLYSAAQNGAPGSDPLRLFATNNGGTAGTFGNDDIQHAVIAKKAATINQIASMTAQLNAFA